jgi:hypothetical protein
MRKLGFFLVAAACACAQKQLLPRKAEGTPVVEVRGAVRSGPHTLGRADLARLPRLKVRGVDPRTGRSAEWEGPALVVLVSDRVDLKRGADTVLVRTTDGAATPIPLPVIRQLHPVFADKVDGAPLAVPEIAWPTAEQRGLATDPRAASWWARDVVAFELVDWQRTFGPVLSPPEGAADAARRGSGVYAESCIGCHKLRGQGGQRGPDLTTVATRLKPEAFAAMLPSHPGWTERRLRDSPDEESSAEVWSFLRAVASVPPTATPAGDEIAAERGTGSTAGGAPGQSNP